MPAKKKILLVEDDNNFGSILRDYLTLHSYETTLAKNGIEGLEKFRKYNYDLCILDVMMPFKDGFSLASDIRSINQEIPIIFLTAKSLKQDVVKGFKIGGAQISPKHAGVIINTGNATGENILHLVEYIKSSILTHYRIQLELEQILI